YEPAPSLLGSLPQMPEWYLAVAILMALSTVSLIWSPLKLLLPLLLGFVLPPLAQASLSAARASFNDAPLHGAARLKRRLLTAALHLLQPLARLRGRPQYGLAPWRRGSPGRAAPPRLGRGPPERSSRQSPSRSVSASSSSVPAPPLSSPGPSGG